LYADHYKDNRRRKVSSVGRSEKAITFTMIGEGLAEGGVSRTYGEMTNGSWTLTQADGIKAGTTYTVVESHVDFEMISRMTAVTVNGAAGEMTETTTEYGVAVSCIVQVVTDADNTDSAHGTIAFTNTYTKPGAELPSTGGSGTVIYTIAGMAMIVLAGVLLVSRRKRKV